MNYLDLKSINSINLTQDDSYIYFQQGAKPYIWNLSGNSDEDDFFGLDNSNFGNNYLVNGTKTWTTLAQHADWIFCLVRTETTDIKQEGISFLLIDMKSKGVEVKPIITIDGAHEVNMVYFDDVEVPANNLIGEEGQGWNIAKFLLMHERTGIAGIAALKRELKRLKEISSELIVAGASLLEDTNFRNKIEAAET